MVVFLQYFLWHHYFLDYIFLDRICHCKYIWFIALQLNHNESWVRVLTSPEFYYFNSLSSHYLFLSMILLPEWSPALTLKNSMNASLTGCETVIHLKMEILLLLIEKHFVALMTRVVAVVRFI